MGKERARRVCQRNVVLFQYFRVTRATEVTAIFAPTKHPILSTHPPFKKVAIATSDDSTSNTTALMLLIFFPKVIRGCHDNFFKRGV